MLRYRTQPAAAALCSLISHRVNTAARGAAASYINGLLSARALRMRSGSAKPRGLPIGVTYVWLTRGSEGHTVLSHNQSHTGSQGFAR
jgi:hypothetical protein